MSGPDAQELADGKAKQIYTRSREKCKKQSFPQVAFGRDLRLEIPELGISHQLLRLLDQQMAVIISGKKVEGVPPSKDLPIPTKKYDSQRVNHSE